MVYKFELYGNSVKTHGILGVSMHEGQYIPIYTHVQ